MRPEVFDAVIFSSSAMRAISSSFVGSVMVVLSVSLCFSHGDQIATDCSDFGTLVANVCIHLAFEHLKRYCAGAQYGIVKLVQRKTRSQRVLNLFPKFDEFKFANHIGTCL